VVILTGAGPLLRWAGHGEPGKHAREHTEEHRRDAENMAGVLRTLYEFPKPVIAAVNGRPLPEHGLATLADFTLASPRRSSL